MAFRTRRERRAATTWRLHKPNWVDPFPHIPGTEPEKRVFEVLYNLRIYFIYQGQIPEFEKGRKFFSLRPGVPYKPDFVLPEHHVIIDPFGFYHHSLASAGERDATKISMYSAAGYAYYHPWWGVPGTPRDRWVWKQEHDLVEAAENVRVRSYFKMPQSLYRDLRGKRKLQATGLTTLEMVWSIPEIIAGPRYKLQDQEDIRAKQTRGYRVGEFVGAGATSVAASNKARAKPKNLKVGGVRRR